MSRNPRSLHDLSQLKPAPIRLVAIGIASAEAFGVPDVIDDWDVELDNEFLLAAD